jgi:hypothetical protein
LHITSSRSKGKVCMPGWLLHAFQQKRSAIPGRVALQQDKVQMCLCMASQLPEERCRPRSLGFWHHSPHHHHRKMSSGRHNPPRHHPRSQSSSHHNPLCHRLRSRSSWHRSPHHHHRKRSSGRHNPPRHHPRSRSSSWTRSPRCHRPRMWGPERRSLRCHHPRRSSCHYHPRSHPVTCMQLASDSALCIFGKMTRQSCLLTPELGT